MTRAPAARTRSRVDPRAQAPPRGPPRVKSVMRAHGLHTVCEEARCPNRGRVLRARHGHVPPARRRLHAGLRVLRHRERQAPAGRPAGAVARARRRRRQMALPVRRPDLGRPRRSSRRRRGPLRGDDRRGPLPRAFAGRRGPDAGLSRDDTSRSRRSSRRSRTSSITTSRRFRRLYREVRRGASLERSLALLSTVKDLDPTRTTKSGFMLGLGERPEEVGGAARAPARGPCRHRHDRPVPPAFPREPPGRRVRAARGLRAPARGGRGAGLPPRLRGPLRAVLVPRGGGARGVLRRGCGRRSVLAPGVTSRRGRALGAPLRAGVSAVRRRRCSSRSPSCPGSSRSRAKRAGRARSSPARSSASSTGASRSGGSRTSSRSTAARAGIMGAVCLLILADDPRRVAGPRRLGHGGGGARREAPPASPSFRFSGPPPSTRARSSTRASPGTSRATRSFGSPSGCRSASVWGVYGLGLAVAAVAALLARAIVVRRARPAVAAALLVAALGIFGAFRLARPAAGTADGEALSVALLQPNLTEEMRSTLEGRAGCLRGAPRAGPRGGGGASRPDRDSRSRRSRPCWQGSERIRRTSPAIAARRAARALQRP